MKNWIQNGNWVIVILLILASTGGGWAVVAPPASDTAVKRDGTTLHPEKLEQLYLKLQKISSEMEEEQTRWKNSLASIKEELQQLETYFGEENQPAKYCSGKVAWALGEECPKE